MSEEIDLAGLLAFYRLTPENWERDLLDETRIILRSLWTERKKYYKGAPPETMAGGEVPPVDSVLQGDESEEDCEDCEKEDEEQCPEGQVWNEEHTRCVPADEADESEEESEEVDEEKVKTVPFKATKSIEELINPR